MVMKDPGDIMKILVCDDEWQVRKELKNIINELFGEDSCEVCEDKESLLEAVEYDNFDVVIMDIEWNGEEKGISFAEMLQSKCPSTEIIYLTGYALKYVQQVFLKSANLSGFLMKPLDVELLKENLKKVLKKKEENARMKFFFQYKGTRFSLEYNQIYYIESLGRKLCICTNKEVYYCYKKLDDVEEEFPKQFIRCHQSYLVNMNKIRKLDKKHILLLDNNQEIPISKIRYKATQEQFFAHLRNKAFWE